MQPSSQDLELTARAVLLLRARRASSWTDAEFMAVMRARMTAPVKGLLEFLGSCGLLENEGAVWHVSPAGEDAFGRLATEDWSPYAHALLASGAYERELARLLEGGTENGDQLRCPLAALPRLAPRAGALLAWNPDLREGHDLVVPLALLDTLLASSAMESAAEIPSWVQDNNTVGWRAELYSLRLERGRLGAMRVMHTSRDAGDGFGYDIETTGCDSRLIEVKGSRSAVVGFISAAASLRSPAKRPSATSFISGARSTSAATQPMSTRLCVGASTPWSSLTLPRRSRAEDSRCSRAPGFSPKRFRSGPFDDLGRGRNQLM